MKELNTVKVQDVNGGCTIDINGNGGFGGHITD